MVRAFFACTVHNSCGDSMIDRYASDDTDFLAQWKFSGDKHKSLQVETERIFHQRYTALSFKNALNFQYP